jgi:hypothetical protein
VKGQSSDSDFLTFLAIKDNGVLISF